MVDDIEKGIGDTGVRAGIIGEIGCSWPLKTSELKVLKASALAQRRTGAAITIHPGRHPDSPFEIAQALDSAGADLTRVVMGHMERSNLPWDRLLAFANTGCVMEYDWFGEVRPSFPYGRTDAYVDTKLFAVEVPSDGERLRTIGRLIDHGYGERIVMSQDVCFKTRLTAFGGSATRISPAMSGAGCPKWGSARARSALFCSRRRREFLPWLDASVRIVPARSPRPITWRDACLVLAAGWQGTTGGRGNLTAQWGCPTLPR